jgi:two-component system, NarL family, response regulator LiaR
VSPITIVLIDDHHVVRRGLRSFLESFADLRISGEAASGEAALTSMATWNPAVVILDLLLPGGMDGIQTLRELRARWPRIRVVVLTSATDDARVVAALRAGAIGYIRKDADPDVLLLAIRAAAKGQPLLDPAVAGALVHDLNIQDAKDTLTPREQAVLCELAWGKTNRAIAESLCISEETVKTHVGNVLLKLHVQHRTQAALYAVKWGLVVLDDLSPARLHRSSAAPQEE